MPDRFHLWNPRAWIREWWPVIALALIAILVLSAGVLSPPDRRLHALELRVEGLERSRDQLTSALNGALEAVQHVLAVVESLTDQIEGAK